MTEREERFVLQHTWYKRLALFASREASHVSTFCFSKGYEIISGKMKKQILMVLRLWAINNQTNYIENLGLK